MDNSAVKSIFKSGNDEERLKKALLEKWAYYINSTREKNG